MEFLGRGWSPATELVLYSFLMVVTEKPAAVFLVFAVLKGLHELGLVIERHRGPAVASPPER